jgi:hypothetical protein
VLDRFSPILHLVQTIRDEAHRFAVTFHRTRRNARTLTSELDGAQAFWKLGTGARGRPGATLRRGGTGGGAADQAALRRAVSREGTRIN